VLRDCGGKGGAYERHGKGTYTSQRFVARHQVARTRGSAGRVPLTEVEARHAAPACHCQSAMCWRQSRPEDHLKQPCLLISSWICRQPFKLRLPTYILREGWYWKGVCTDFRWSACTPACACAWTLMVIDCCRVAGRHNRCSRSRRPFQS
jgi:hypothetical protein